MFIVYCLLLIICFLIYLFVYLFINCIRANKAFTFGTPKGKQQLEAGYLIEKIIFGSAEKEYWLFFEISIITDKEEWNKERSFFKEKDLKDV